MHLPNAHLAVVEQAKITDYLLNAAHPDNGGKARFFLTLGFTLDAWQELANALRHMAVNTPVTHRAESNHGEKFILEGNISSPSGRTGRVRSVWIIDAGLTTPRLVTAYPRS
jgi:hypothetical protein